MKRKLPEIKYQPKLNLGCGHLVEKDSIGIDFHDCGQEVIWDIKDGLPFPDSSFEIVCSSHFLEHLTDKENKELFKEIYRVLKPGGETQHVMPHLKDPTARFFGHFSLWNKAKVNSIPNVEGLEGFKVISVVDIKDGGRGSILELAFSLKKL